MSFMDKECCPEFDPKKWENKTHKWKNKTFIKDSIPAFFHIPFFPLIGKKITRMGKAIEKEKAYKNKKDVLMLFYDPSAFKSELYMSTTKKIPNEANVKISGTFISKVFEGPYGAVPKFMKKMDVYLEKKGKKAKKYLIHYAYCPKCVKKFGKNYSVLFAQVK